MRKAAIVTTAIVAIALAGLSVSVRPASAQACVGGIIIAAFYASATENRELSATEAATCGLFYGADRDKAVKGKSPSAKAPAKKPAKTAAKTAAKARPQ